MNISVNELAQHLDKYFVIDVREPSELVHDGSVKSAVNIPMNSVPANLTKIPKDKPVAVICRSGMRSANVCGFLRAQGYTNIVNVEGGNNAWQRLGVK